MLTPVKKRYDIQVTSANQTFTQTFELDKNIMVIKGLLFTSDKDDLLYYRGTQRLEINNKEYFPDNYESKLFMSGINVPPAPSSSTFEPEQPGNGLVKVSYQDKDDGRSVFAPYRVSLYLDCEMEDEL